MKFEQALNAMREGKYARFEGETYFIDDENTLVKHPDDDSDGLRDESIVVVAVLYGDEIMSDDWVIIND